MKVEHLINNAQLTAGERFLVLSWAAASFAWFFCKNNLLWSPCACDGLLYLGTALAASIALAVDTRRQEKRRFLVTLVLLAGTINGMACLQKLCALPRELPFAMTLGLLGWLLIAAWPFRSTITQQSTLPKITVCILIAFALASIIGRYLAGEPFIH